MARATKIKGIGTARLPRVAMHSQLPRFLVPSSASFCNHGVSPHYERVTHPPTFSVVPPLPDITSCSQSTTQPHHPSVDVCPPPAPPETPPGLCCNSDTHSEQISPKTASVTDLPDHVNLLFLQTVEDNTLSPEVSEELKTLYFRSPKYFR